MPVEEKQKIADDADMIVNGYSFTYKDDNVMVVNLNLAIPHAMLMTREGKMLESSMEPIEQTIAMEIWSENKEFMEVKSA